MGETRCGFALLSGSRFALPTVFAFRLSARGSSGFRKGGGQRTRKRVVSRRVLTVLRVAPGSCPAEVARSPMVWRDAPSCYPRHRWAGARRHGRRFCPSTPVGETTRKREGGENAKEQPEVAARRGWLPDNRNEAGVRNIDVAGEQRSGGALAGAQQGRRHDLAVVHLTDARQREREVEDRAIEGHHYKANSSSPCHSASLKSSSVVSLSPLYLPYSR